MRYNISFLFLAFLIISIKAFPQSAKELALCIRVTNKINDTNKTTGFTLHVFSTEKTIYTGYNLKPDTCIWVKGVDGMQYKALVMGEGFKTKEVFWRFDSLANKQQINIHLEEQIITLKEVIVKAEREIYKRGDTLVIPVDHIRTRPHASATELLEKLPGVSVSEGNVTAFGQQINKIKVDGNELFGGNPKATLENIKADMIRDIEILNIEGSGEGSPELNLKLKKDKKEGIYGEVYVQGGTYSRYNTGLKINAIKPAAFFNFFLNNNNRNQQALSVQEYLRLVNFNNNFAANTLGTQKIYYDFKSEDPFGSFTRLLRNFSFLDKGIKESWSSGLNFSKTFSKINWNGYILLSRDRSALQEDVNTIRFLFPLKSQNITERFTAAGNTDIVGESTVKWKPDEKNSIEGKLTVGRQVIKENPSGKIFSLLFNNTDSLLQSGFINNSQDNKNRMNMLFARGAWERRYNKTAQKTTLTGGVLINKTSFEQIYNNEFTANNITLIQNHNSIDQSGNNRNVYAQLQHSFPLSKKFLLDMRIGSMFNNSVINRSGFSFNAADNKFDKYNPALSANNFQVENKHGVAQAFLFYKSGGISAIAGIGALSSNWSVHLGNSLLNNKKTVTFLPNLFIRYGFNQSNISFRHVTEQNAPLTQNLLPVTDSSMIQQVNRGNSMLSPYLYKKYELTSAIFIKGLGTINGSINYSHTRLPVNFIYQRDDGFYPVQSYAQFMDADEVNGSLALVKFSPGQKFNPYIFLFYLWRRQYQLTQGVIKPFQFYAFSPIIGARLMISKEHSINFSIQSSLSEAKNENVKSQGLNKRFYFDIKQDNLLPGGIYYQLAAKWILIQSPSHTSVIKPVMNFNLSKYLTQKQNWQINIGVNNLLNVNLIREFNINSIQETTSSYNYLSRYFSVGATFYPQKWNK